MDGLEIIVTYTMTKREETIVAICFGIIVFCVMYTIWEAYRIIKKPNEEYGVTFDVYEEHKGGQTWVDEKEARISPRDGRW